MGAASASCFSTLLPHHPLSPCTHRVCRLDSSLRLVNALGGTIGPFHDFLFFFSPCLLLATPLLRCDPRRFMMSDPASRFRPPFPSTLPPMASQKNATALQNLLIGSFFIFSTFSFFFDFYVALFPVRSFPGRAVEELAPQVSLCLFMMPSSLLEAGAFLPLIYLPRRRAVTGPSGFCFLYVIFFFLFLFFLKFPVCCSYILISFRFRVHGFVWFR